MIKRRSTNAGWQIILMLAIAMGFTPMADAQYEEIEAIVADGEEAPGTWPLTVSGANFDIDVIPDSQLGGAGSNNLSVSLDGWGPIKWTESRHNEGDFATVIGPSDTGEDSDPPEGFVDDYQADTGPTTHGWRVNYRLGLPISTTRVNGRDNGDTLDGEAVGTFYGATNFNVGFAQGWSYSMITGEYSNGGDGASDLVTGFIGPPDEASFDVGVAFFPYAQGWLGGIVDAELAGEWFEEPDAETGLASYNVNAFDESPVTFDDEDGKARLELADGLGPDTGMLFVASSDSSSQLKLASAYPSDGGWDVAIRESADNDTTGQTLAAIGENDSDFMFLYVDYNSQGLVGGHVNGSDGNTITGKGDYTLTRSGDGQYQLSIPGKVGQDGMLLLSNAGLQSGTTDLADRAAMSYEYDAESGNFVIESHEFVSTDLDDASTWTWPARDTDFYFTWVDFTNPLSPPGEAGGCDVNGDGVCDASDIDAMSQMVIDGTATKEERTALIEGPMPDGFNTWIGDSDMNGQFDEQDIVAAFVGGKYLTGERAGWTEGDWDGNLVFNDQDFVDAFVAGGYLQGPRAAAVPEPSACLLMLLGGLIVARRIRR